MSTCEPLAILPVMPLSRTHRPQRFTDVTGQEHVTETLRAEVAKNMLGHAYLFSGPRGVGKTTSARIFAKALICENANNGEPCNTCDACTSVANGSCIDVIEIDAASHSRVEETREAIIEHVRFAPARWKYKVYILDEAHQLSGHSWNALLKTLEEPPAYAIFILATTELHKVPATIVSRCQRFEFKRIAPDAMRARLNALAKEEGVTLADDATAAIISAADGYVRDAESLLEQLVSLGEKKITRELAELILPSSSLPAVAALLTTAGTRNVAQTLTDLRTLFEDGQQPLTLLDDLLAAARLLIRAEDPSEAARLKNGDDGQKAIHALMGTYGLGELNSMALMLIERRRDAKLGIDAVFACELALTAIAGQLLPHAPKQAGAPNQNSQTPPTPPPAPKPPAPPVNAPEPEKKPEPTPEPAPVPTPAPAAEFTAPQPTPPQTDVTLHDVLLKWREIIRLVEEENRSLPFVLKITKPESIQGNKVILRFQYPFHQEKIIQDLKSKRIVENALRKAVANNTLIIDGVIGEIIGEADRTSTKDIVSNVINAFGGTVAE